MDILKKTVEINTWVWQFLRWKQGFTKKYIEFWDVVKHKIKKIDGSKETDYKKDYIKIKFESDDDLLLNKPLISYEMHIFVWGFLKKIVNCIQNFV